MFFTIFDAFSEFHGLGNGGTRWNYGAGAGGRGMAYVILRHGGVAGSPIYPMDRMIFLAQEIPQLRRRVSTMQMLLQEPTSGNITMQDQAVRYLAYVVVRILGLWLPTMS